LRSAERLGGPTSRLSRPPVQSIDHPNFYAPALALRISLEDFGVYLAGEWEREVPAMVEAVWEHQLPGSRRPHGDPGRRSPLPGLVAVLRWASALVALVLLGWGLVSAARTSYLQSRLLSRWAADMTFEV